MPDTDVRLIIDGAAVEELLRGPTGPVFSHLVKIGDEIILRARGRIHNRTGRLAAGIVKRFGEVDTGLTLSVVAGIGLKPGYAVWVHEGNAPEGTRIYPKTAKVLVFAADNTRAMPRGSATFPALIFAKSVRASKPNPYLREPMNEVIAETSI